ncbi:unknown [Lucerne transient streak virus]|uniref:Uncharacterized protein n=1 Tax=Lucerne transient streak virus TaxID=12470 RepID=Q83094_9VIRU|nr:unknown [Lucerne transient streak virus]
MPLSEVGRSNCKFREASGKTTGDAVIAAGEIFPELKQYSWPKRGSGAERGSLLFQAGRFRPTSPPANLAESVRKLASKYPATTVYRVLRGTEWSKEEIAKEARKIGETEVNPKASPGPALRPGSKQRRSLEQARRSCVHSSSRKANSAVRGRLGSPSEAQRFSSFGSL